MLVLSNTMLNEAQDIESHINIRLVHMNTQKNFSICTYSESPQCIDKPQLGQRQFYTHTHTHIHSFDFHVHETVM